MLEDGARRRITGGRETEVLEFLAVPAAMTAVAEGRLIGSEIDWVGGGQLELIHPLVDFPSYCWEWPPAMWLTAAELTLELGMEMAESGWILKDAAPHNVLFRGSRPVFVDVLSFERWDGKPVWRAYGQFVRTFLLPMLAHARLGWPLSGILLRRDGLEPEEVYQAMGWAERLRPSALRAVTLPKLLGRVGRVTSIPSGPKGPGTFEPATAGLQSRTFKRERLSAPITGRKSHPFETERPEVALDVVRATMRGLERQMRAAVPPSRRSKWSEYVESASHYGGEDHAAKQAFVERVLAAERPGWVLDVGSNTGTYAMIAALGGAEVVAIDSDMETVDRLVKDAAESGGAAARIQSLCVDVAQPTPAAGWDNRESLSFLARAEGRFDMVMMLAVIHHLLLTSQIPLKEIAKLCARLTRRGLLVEWVPVSDPRFQELIRGREALYTELSEEAFREAMAVHFELRGEKRLSNGRALLHLRRRG